MIRQFLVFVFLFLVLASCRWAVLLTQTFFNSHIEPQKKEGSDRYTIGEKEFKLDFFFFSQSLSFLFLFLFFLGFLLLLLFRMVLNSEKAEKVS